MINKKGLTMINLPPSEPAPRTLLLETGSVQPNVVVDALNHHRIVTDQGEIEIVITPSDGSARSLSGDAGTLFGLSRRFSRWITSTRTISHLGLTLSVVGGIGLVWSLAAGGSDRQIFNVSMTMVLSAIAFQILERVLARADRLETLVLHAKKTDA
jgi:hypothetical protein